MDLEITDVGVSTEVLRLAWRGNCFQVADIYGHF